MILNPATKYHINDINPSAFIPKNGPPAACDSPGVLRAASRRLAEGDRALQDPQHPALPGSYHGSVKAGRPRYGPLDHGLALPVLKQCDVWAGAGRSCPALPAGTLRPLLSSPLLPAGRGTAYPRRRAAPAVRAVARGQPPSPGMAPNPRTAHAQKPNPTATPTSHGHGEQPERLGNLRR